MKSQRLKFIGAAVLAIVLVAIAAVSETQGRHAHWRGQDGMFGGPGFGFLARNLNLTDAQKDQAKQIMANEKTTFKPLMQQMRQSKMQERQLVEAATFDQAQAQTLAVQQSQLSAQVNVEKMRMESQLYQILTQEQKDKLNSILDQRAQRFQQHQQEQQQQQPSNQ
ncbi:MAG TPA: Spy/CpxP family protein refolding chaperone [Terriglobales bacterium]|jgi:Spy/CpxP family protein refolding chaperone